MSHELSVKIAAQPVCYPIKIGGNILDFSTWLPQKAASCWVIITDNIVKKQYGLSLHTALKNAGYPSLLLSFPSGEAFKTNATKQTIENAMLKHRCDRDTVIIALGGGIVGDVAGFIAATYLRGVSYLQLPTTLLAMLDSSIGGKTGVNTEHGKNLIGAIYQPMAVMVDVTLLKTLPQKHLINGLIEAIKVFLTHDASYFFYTQTHLARILQGEADCIIDIVACAINIKAGVVSRDEKEQGERSVLNFGHTIGHALEVISDYKLLHGHAVAYGILVEATISHQLGFLEASQLTIIKNLMATLGFHGHYLKKFNPNQVIQATKQDKKARHGKVHYTLIQGIGSAYVHHGNYTHVVDDRVVLQAVSISQTN